MAARPTTPASPKNVKVNSPVPGTPLFGCGQFCIPHASRRCILYDLILTPRIEHVQLLLSNSQDVTNSSIQYYKMLLRVIFDKDPIIAQTSKTTDGQITTSLTSNYLCLQCSAILPEEERAKHGNKKSHRFCR